MQDEVQSDFFEDDEEDLFTSLIPVNDHQIACDGLDLIDMLNFSESVDEVEEIFFKRLGLTYTMEEDEMGFEMRRYNELSEEKAYLLTFPDGTDLSDFDIVDVLSIEELAQETYNDLVVAAGETPCDGDCENCSQDCIGKKPID